MTTGQRPSAIALPEGGVYLDNNAAALVLFLLQFHAVSTGPRDGVTGGAKGSPLVRQIQAACASSTRQPVGDVRSVSPDGQPRRTSAPLTARSTSPRPDDLLTITETAEELNMTTRHVRRIARSGQLGDVVHVGRVLQVRRFEVDAYTQRKRSTP